MSSKLNLEQRSALVSMGYRKPIIHADRWIKPVGYKVYVFFEDNLKIGLYFKDRYDETACWSTRQYNEEEYTDFLSFITSYEEYNGCRTNVYHEEQKFNFITSEEQANLLLGSL